MNRRRFLRNAAALPFVFGLRDLLGQDADAGRPDWHLAAFRRMKETGRNGVVIVVPDPERDELVSEAVGGGTKITRVLQDAARRRVGLALWTLANEEHPGAHAIFTEAVFVCMTSELADRLVRRPGDPKNRFLLDPEGRTIAADTVDATVLESPEAFTPSFTRFLHGGDGARLRERAEAVGKTLDDRLRKSLSRLSSESAEERDAAQAAILERADSIAPFLVQQSIAAPEAETRGRLKDVLASLYAPGREGAAGFRLPYGSYLPEFAEACGHLRLKEEAAVECGLGRAPLRSRKFLRFLAK